MTRDDTRSTATSRATNVLLYRSLAGWHVGEQPMYGQNTGYDTPLVMQIILPSTVELARLAQAEEAAWAEANPGVRPREMV